MAFNPISIDDDTALLDGRGGPTAASLSFAPPSRTLNHNAHSHVDGHGVAASPMSEDGPFTPNTSVAKAAGMCKAHYHLDFSWSVPYPQLPESPLLYFPAEYTELLTNPAAVGVMQTELDAMASGVLEKIPLAYYPLKPGVVAETRAAALDTERHLDEMRRHAQASGQLERLVWRPEDVNPMLSEADAKLLDTDLDGDVVLRRDLPSLTLLQRPLYTDMGLVPPEERHSARLARIVPQELRHLSQGADLPGSPLSPASPLGGALNTASSVFETEAEAAAKRKTWAEEVKRSFRNVRGIDDAYDRFLESLVHGKLGLDKQNASHMGLGRALWMLLLDGSTTSAQQRGAWHAICRFSFTYDQSASAGAGLTTALRELRAALLERKLPEFAQRWSPMIDAYTQAVKQYVAGLAGGAAARKAQLHFSDLELDPQHRGGFVPELEVGGPLQRLGKEFGENHARLPIFPVEVIPVFPSAFDKAAKEGISAAKSDEGELDYLAEAAEGLHHVILPGATVPERARAGPHVLVGDTNLLVADAQSGVADVQAVGATVGYHTTPQNTFEALFHDSDNTSSYVLRLHSLPRGSSPSSSPHLKGATSKDGTYITYDRVGWRDVYAKAPTVRAPPFQRYVLVFGEDGEAKEAPQPQTPGGEGWGAERHGDGDGDGKRGREEHEGAERGDREARRVKVESSS